MLHTTSRMLVAVGRNSKVGLDIYPIPLVDERSMALFREHLAFREIAGQQTQKVL